MEIFQTDTLHTYIQTHHSQNYLTAVGCSCGTRQATVRTHNQLTCNKMTSSECIPLMVVKRFHLWLVYVKNHNNQTVAKKNQQLLRTSVFEDEQELIATPY